jgi:hypothetical protein
MSEDERVVFKAYQKFILDVLDEIDKEDEELDRMVLSSSSRDRPFPGAAMPSQSASELEGPKSAIPKPSKAEREGAEAAKLLTQVFRLENQGKMDDAKALRSTIPIGKILGDRSLNKLALDLQNRALSVGGLGTIEAVLERFVKRPLVRQVLAAPYFD